MKKKKKHHLHLARCCSNISNPSTSTCLVLRCSVKLMVLQWNESSFLKSMQITAYLWCSLFIFLVPDPIECPCGFLLFSHTPCMLSCSAVTTTWRNWLQTIKTEDVDSPIWMAIWSKVVHLHAVAESPGMPNVHVHLHTDNTALRAQVAQF